MLMSGKLSREQIRDHYITTSQVAKILGISTFNLYVHPERYVEIDHFRTNGGMLWNIFDVYRHKFPSAKREEIQVMILADRDRIQKTRKKREKNKNAKHI